MLIAHGKASSGVGPSGSPGSGEKCDDPEEREHTGLLRFLLL